MMFIHNLYTASLLSVSLSLLVLVVSVPLESLALGRGPSNSYPLPPMNYTTFVVGRGETNNNNIDMMYDFLRDAAAATVTPSPSPSPSPPTPTPTPTPPTTISPNTKTVANYYTGRDRGQRDRYGWVRNNFIRVRDIFGKVNVAFDHLAMK